MWPIPTIENNFITFSFSINTVTCCWMEQINHNKTIVHAYERHHLSSLTLHNLFIFNPTYIHRIITNFLDQHNKHNAYVSFVLDLSPLYERWVTSLSSTPTMADLGLTNSSAFLSGYKLMYHHEKSNYVFYCYKIPRSLLLQYQLVITSLRLNALSIATQTLVLFDAYTQLSNIPFRYSQCALDMTRVNNNITALISTEILSEKLIIPSTISLAKELPYLATTYTITTKGHKP